MIYVLLIKVFQISVCKQCLFDQSLHHHRPLLPLTLLHFLLQILHLIRFSCYHFFIQFLFILLIRCFHFHFLVVLLFLFIIVRYHHFHFAELDFHPLLFSILLEDLPLPPPLFLHLRILIFLLLQILIFLRFDFLSNFFLKFTFQFFPNLLPLFPHYCLLHSLPLLLQFILFVYFYLTYFLIFIVYYFVHFLRQIIHFLVYFKFLNFIWTLNYSKYFTNLCHY